MNYETAYKRLEEVVSHLQKDLLKYAERDDSSERFINARNEAINKIIEFAEQSEIRISTLEEELLQWQYNYIKLHEDTSKLVMFCALHNINPNMVFHYQVEELKAMVAEGIKIKPPVMDLNKLMVVPHETDGYELKYANEEETFTEDAKIRALENKYLTLKQIVKPN
ncbi:hypothetical protein [Mucilaginibacter sp.]|uniref:hypothetical protein n=1 Tax=Mucilaginibacter sp. TaxID=1882438 RepID=UPI0035BC33F2